MSAIPVRIVLPVPRQVGIARRGDDWYWVAPLFASCAATAAVLAASRQNWTQWQAALAYALIAIPCFAYAGWRRSRQTLLPLFAILSAAHAVFYGVSLFSNDILSESSPLTRTAVLAMALLGVTGLFVGMKLGASPKMRVRLPDIPADPRRWTLIRIIAACQIVVPFLPVGSGGEFRQAVVIVVSFVPLVAFLILWDATLRGGGCGIDRFLVGNFLACSILAGLATGWLGGCVGNLIVAGIGFVRVRRRLPVIPLGAILLVMLFLQGGKASFRERYWYGDGAAPAFTKARFWIEKSAERLSGITSRRDGAGLRDSLEPLLTRTSLVKEAATVYESTPAIVPYQHGATYRYLLVTLIPRFLWPGKPSVNDANRFYQLSYGVTQPNRLDSVAIGSGLVAEAYMNFGWPGIPIVLCLGGMILGAFERIFLSHQSGAFASAIGLAYVLQLLSLNGQAAAYFGGMIQIIVLAILIFLPGLCFRNRKARLFCRVRAPHGGTA